MPNESLTYQRHLLTRRALKWQYTCSNADTFCAAASNVRSLSSLWCSLSLLTARNTSSRLVSPKPYVAIFYYSFCDSRYSNIAENNALPSLSFFEHLKSTLMSDLPITSQSTNLPRFSSNSFYLVIFSVNSICNLYPPPNFCFKNKLDPQHLIFPSPIIAILSPK